MNVFKWSKAPIVLVVAAGLGAACSQTDTHDLAPRAVASAYTTQPVVWPLDAQWIALDANGVPITDPTGDASGSRDILGTTTSPAAYVFTDAYHMYFRLRLGSTPIQSGSKLAPFGWGCEFDTDGNPQTYEFIAQVNGITSGDAVELSQNTVQGSLNSPSDKAEVLLATYSALLDNVWNMTPAHARALPAGTTLGGGADYFIDWAIDLNDFPTSVNLASNPFRLVCGSSNNAQTLNADLISSTNATTLSGLASDPVLCGPTGCTQCISASACGPTCAACGGATPVCAPFVGCVQCQADSDCASGNFCDTGTNSCTPKLANGTAIPTVANHTPTLNGTCTSAAGAAVCASGVCDPTDNECGIALGHGTCSSTSMCRSGVCSASGVCQAVSSCMSDSDCASTQYCDTSQAQCVAKLANGTAIPTIAGHAPVLNGTCTTAAGASVCVAAVCDTADNLCGFANGDGTCDATTAATVCRSGTCSTSGVCIAANSCVVDADCPSTQFCDTAQKSCVPKLANGTAIPTIAGHTPALSGTCMTDVAAAVCVSGVCDATDNKCGLANGDTGCTAANAATVCRSGACDADGKCGIANGAGTCTASNAATICRSGVCDPNDGKCGYADGAGTCTSANAATVCRGGACSSTGVCESAGTCTVDADCTSTQFCDTSQKKCVAKLSNGTSIPSIGGHTPTLDGICTSDVGAAVCAAGVCDTADQKCGYANGDGSCTPATATLVCRSGACGGDGTCGRIGGESCTTSADCRNGDCESGTCAQADAGTDAGTDAGDSSADAAFVPPEFGSVQGGGCSTSGGGTTGGTFVGVAFGLGLALRSMRRGRRR